jgi:hypothetical protein
MKSIKAALESSRNSLRRKATKTAAFGSRLFPSRTPKNDTSLQVRLDAGALVNGRWLWIYLQANKEAKDGPLKKFIKKNGTHANLAAVLFDTEAEDKEAELDRVVTELEEKAQQSLDG